jgi:hypothetical protein
MSAVAAGDVVERVRVGCHAVEQALHGADSHLGVVVESTRLSVENMERLIRLQESDSCAWSLASHFWC